MPQEPRLGIVAPSRAPQTPDETRRLLLAVPEVVMMPELEEHVFDSERLESVRELGKKEQIVTLADAAFREAVGNSLEALAARARREQNEGLFFLAKTLAHFVGTLPANEHPLLVGLYVRSLLRFEGAEETGAAVALRMDDPEWG